VQGAFVNFVHFLLNPHGEIMFSASEMKSQLGAKALELGFAELRCASVVGPAAHAGEFLEWIEEGHHGDMAWLAKNTHRRVDPREVLPGARTVLVLATNYFQAPRVQGDLTSLGGVRGEISRYAWGADYHDVIERRLDLLASEVEALGGRQRRYVDTGPVLERDWASAAGLGWNGKSTVQIHPKLGAWFFLGEIITDLELPPDAPLRLTCGSCVRCMTACPTGAIDRPHHLAAGRCLSYLSIEHKGSIPLEFRRAMGGRIYGCDACVEACPWNRFAQESREVQFAAREFVDWPLRDFLALSDESFRQLFRGNPIKRIKLPAFLRNVCVALGNVGTVEDLPALRLAAQRPEPMVGEHACWAIEEIASRLGS
jgi:epoxyqueuosine reductase